jgi:hypothetical protein
MGKPMALGLYGLAETTRAIFVKISHGWLPHGHVGNRNIARPATLESVAQRSELVR